MSEERKPVWPWIIGLLILLPAVYLASFFAVYWLFAFGYWPRWAQIAANTIYSPLIWLVERFIIG